MSARASAYERLLDALHEHGSTVKANGVSAVAQCPAHDDRNPSLSVRRIEGSVLLHCHAGCHVEDVLAALNLSAGDLYDERSGARYDYTDPAGKVLRTVHRSPLKDFRQSGDTKGTAPLYRLSAVTQAVQDGTTVYVCEGEKDVHAVESLGAVATTSPMGATNAHRADWTPLAGADVVVVADRDPAGKRYASDVLALLDGRAASVRVALPRVGEDAADHVAAGHGLDELEPVELEELNLRAAIRERFPRLDLVALLQADRPPREWVVDGLIPAGASVALVAPAGTGKSLLLLALCIAVARGQRTFAGLRVTGRRVLLVDMENTQDDLADRLQALGVTPDTAVELDQLVTIHLPPLAPLDAAIGGVELAAILDAYDVQPGDVVVLDSLQRVINGAENDSDTMRAYYRHTAVMLKRRGVTVIRTDNTGKDTDKGARGTSGKRDDVDVELVLTADAEHPERLRIRPGKARVTGIQPVVVNRVIDDDGRLTYSTAGDPFRVAVADAHRALDDLQVPTDAGERKAAEAVKAAGRKVVRAALRVAVKERRDPLNVRGLGAPSPYGAPAGENAPADCAEQVRRTFGAPEPVRTNVQVSTANDCAEQVRRTNGAPASDAHGGGAPPRSLSIERRTGAYEPQENNDPPALVGTCAKCQATNVPLVGLDTRGRAACADCAAPRPEATP